jgi:hypothetical protein
MTSEEEENCIRKDERDGVLNKVISLINKNTFELEGKRLKITPLLLLQEIDKLRANGGV